MKSDITIIVSSCDAYADCWEPFFKLFGTFWPNCPYPMVLITETRCYDGPYGKVQSFPALTVSGKRKLEWGGRLIECLRRLECQTVLYLQEDFFLTAPVDEGQIVEFADYMSKMSWTYEFIMQIGLCPCSSNGPFHLTENSLLWEVDRQARYRFSMLPGLWNREDLLGYLRANDSVWEFESSSHIRARRTPKRVLTVNRHIYCPNGKQIYPYFSPAGGLIRGKWSRDSVVDLFKQHGIKMDFSRRGFVDEALVKDPLPPTYSKRIYNTIRRPLVIRINEAIDRFRY